MAFFTYGGIRFKAYVAAATAWIVLIGSVQAEWPFQMTRIEEFRDPRRLSTEVKVEVRVVRTKAEFKPLEPIEFELTATNQTLDHGVAAPDGAAPESEYREFRFRIFDSNGELVPKTRYGDFDVWVVNLRSAGGVGPAIQPGGKLSCFLTANMVADMTSPDEYTILVECPTLMKTTIQGTDVWLVGQSAPIKVKVLADPPRRSAFFPRRTTAEIAKIERDVRAMQRRQDDAIRKAAAPPR